MKDGAVPGLDATVTYNATGTGYGVSFPDGSVELEPLAATMHYNTAIVIPSTTLSPTGESFGGPTVSGIDCAAEVVAHENYHSWVSEQWTTAWSGLTDSDYDPSPITFDGNLMYYDDALPDIYELNVSLTDEFSLTDTYELRNLKSPVYFFYGDQEYMAMRAGNGSRGIPENDWGYPGKQAPRNDGIAFSPPIRQNCAGMCDMVSQGLPEGVLPGVIETPADTNGNSLYDTLTSSNDITINRTGLYEIAAVLSGGAGQEVVSIQRNQSTFATGNYSIASVFPGTDISSAGIDGPYTITLTWRHEYQENGDPSFISWQTTGTYVSTDFEPVSAGFASTATASPASRNLSAVTPLTINKDGEYTIEGYLQDPDGVQIAYAADTATFTTGAANADLVFDGNAIAANNRDGTYALVNFRILDTAGTTISRLADAGTVSIDASDYGNTVAILTDSYSASGTQQNSDGRYEILLVTSAITVPAEGRYYYSASLFDEEGGYIQTFEGTTGVLSVGAATLNLLFSGKDIYTNRVNGTFSVHSLDVYGPTGSDRRSHPFTTGSYNFTEFAGPPVMITGNVTDYPVDLDGDLLYDVIRVGFDVETGTFSSGTATIYLLADLTVPGANQTGVTNTLIAQSGTYNPLLEQQMTHHVTLDFPGTTINGMGIDGPYDLTLLQARGGASTDYYTESYSTAAYDHTLFEPAAILMGTVSNEIGQPLEGVDISADGKNTVTNGGGFYRLFYPTGRSMGVLALPSAALNMSSDYKVLSVSPGTPTYWNITLFSPARVYGTVTAENGTILTEGSVCSDGPTDYCFHLDWWSNGSYQLPNLKNGTYDSIQYTLPGSNLISDQRDTLILPGENRAWNITAYDKRSLEVTVSDIYGNPHGEAEVSITEGPITTTGWGSEPETDAAGVYTFQSLMPGNYTMVVSPNWTYRDLLITNTTNFTIEPADSAVTQNIILMPEPAEPVAGDFISCNTTEGPPPLTVSFADRASGYPTAWLWDFGDGVNSTERRPVHTYTDYGVYNITLTVSNPSGSDTGYFEEWIRVEEEPVPEVQFATGTLDPGASGLVSVSANTIPFQASRLVLNISFDPAVVQFNNAERYGSLDWDIDTTDIDNVAGTAQITVNIGGGPVPQNVMNPFANINFTAVGFGGEESLITADPADWLYFNSGWQYNPLSVTNGSIIINGGGSALPVADFTANLTSGSCPLSVAFDSSLSDVVSPTAYLWTFGDGNTSVLADPVHRYEVVGTHNVALQITNSSGSNTTTMTGYITVTSALPAPVAGFSADIISGDAPLTVAFTSTSTGSIDSYAWDFGDGQTSTSINPSNTYASAGVYTANLTVTNTGGSNSATSSITVTSPVLPVPVVTANATSGTVPMAVQFTSASSVVTSPTTYLWNFGDGNTSVQANPSHSYAVAGTYNVALSITNSSGTNVTTMTGYITASPAPLGVLPLPAFTADTTSGAVPLTVQFSSAPSDAVSPTGYLWTFGDGSTSVLENPSHGYTTVGVYGVSLRIANSSGFNTTTRARYISTHIMVGTNTSLPSNSTITGDQISINLTGSSEY